MEPKAQPQNQQEIVHNANQVTNPTQTTQVLKEEKAPTVNATQPTAGKTSQESNDNKTVNNNTQNDKKVSNPGDQINNQNEQKEPKEPKKENTEVQKQPQQEKPTQLQNKGDTNQTAIKDQTQNSNNQKDVPRKESQSKAQPSKDKQKGNSATSSQNDIKADTQRSEAKKDTITQPKKKSSQDLKEKDAKEKKVDQVNNPKIVKEAGKENKQKPQEGQKKPEPTLGGAFGSILKFFTSTKDKVEGSSSQAITKLQEVVLQSKIVSTIAGTEPKKIETKEENQKPQKSRLNRNQGQKKPTKIETESSSKTLATESTKEKTLPPKESKITIRKAISKPKIAEGSGASPVRGKNEVEEQIRLHKIQEVKKMKKVLLEKLDALNNQLFELEKPGLDSHRDGESPVRVVFNLEEYKQKQKEELDQRKKEALEFAKKMNRERKELEHKREKRRDEQHALVIKDIDVLYQKQLDELASVKGGSAKAKFEENIKKFKQDNMFAALEEKKKNLKIMREFKKISGEDPTEKEDMNEGEQNNSEKKKVAKKPIYKSPVLAQVLKEDEALKKVETEKAQSKKDLYLKKLNYSKEVKSTYLPQVQASKYTFDPDGKIARAVNRSHNIEKHLVRNAGKDSLYNYLDKMRNKYPNISKPRKNSEDESEAEDHKHPVNKYGKEKNNKVKAKHRQEEEEDDYYGEEDMQNYELDEDVNLTDRADRAEVSRNSQSKPKGINNLKSKSHQSGLKRKSVASDEELSEESGVAEKNFESHSKITKKHQVEQKGPKEEDDNEWEEELRNDQQVLKDKISNMLGDIKKIESQMKQKEKRLLEDMEKQKEVDP